MDGVKVRNVGNGENSESIVMDGVHIRKVGNGEHSESIVMVGVKIGKMERVKIPRAS